MVKVHTIEMIEHSAYSVPNVKAHTDMINGSLVGLDGDVTKAPADGEELYIVLNAQVGDDEYSENYPIAKGEFVNLFKLSEWKGKTLDVTLSNIIEGEYDSITEGTELTFDESTFKFKKGSGMFTAGKKFGTNVQGLFVTIKA